MANKPFKIDEILGRVPLRSESVMHGGPGLPPFAFARWLCREIKSLEGELLGPGDSRAASIRLAQLFEVAREYLLFYGTGEGPTVDGLLLDRGAVIFGTCPDCSQDFVWSMELHRKMCPGRPEFCDCAVKGDEGIEIEPSSQWGFVHRVCGKKWAPRYIDTPDNSGDVSE